MIDVYVDGEFTRQQWLWPVPGCEEGETRNDDPARYMHPLANLFSGVVADWEKGNLPCSGGVLDQPARVVSMVRLTQRARNYCQGLKQKQSDWASEVVTKGNAGGAE